MCGNDSLHTYHLLENSAQVLRFPQALKFLNCKRYFVFLIFRERLDELVISPFNTSTNP
jgi:virulence-associated protein VagC